MQKWLKIVFAGLFIYIVFWTSLTYWVEHGGTQKITSFGKQTAEKKALIVYNSDPIYNLGEQLSISFAEGISSQGFYPKVATIDYAEIDSAHYDLYVLCANTYNYAPDKLITKYIKSHTLLENPKVVAITLGAGSTSVSKQLLEEVILS